MYVRDKRSGKGTLTDPDGTKTIGIWENGNMDGQFTIIEPDGTKREAKFENGDEV